MGLSIHYSGTIRNYDQINEMVSEVEDICKSLDWKTQVFPVSNTDNLKGISFGPEESEGIYLTFLPGGRLCSPINLICKDIYETGELDPELLYTASTKTQYAGPDAHIAILKLLYYLKGKYFSAFELMDEGLYWEVWDKKILLSQFAKYEAALQMVTEALSEFKSAPGEDAKSLADRLEEYLQKKLGGGG